MASKNELRDLLILQIENQAEFRREKAAEFPGDLRNTTSAESLERLGKSLHDMAADDPLWVRYWNVYSGPAVPEDLTELSTLEIESLRDYGFNEEQSGDGSKFLEQHVSALESVIFDKHEADSERTH